MARFRAGYEGDYGLRDFDSHRPRYDVGSRGYDRGYRRLDPVDRGERRPWVGGYHEGYHGGSEGIGVNTAPTGGAWIRGEGGPWRAAYERDYRPGREQGGRERGDWPRPARRREAFDRGDQGYVGSGGEYDPRYTRGARDLRGYDRSFPPTDEDYWHDLERHRPRFSPVGGMNPAMGGSALIDRRYGRGYDGGWFNQWSRWF